MDYPIGSSPSSPQVATEATDHEMWQRILAWEGGCSNHPSDKGGFTCLGITASLGRKHGVFNVRSLTPAQAIAIYKKEYPHCAQYQNPGVRAICYDTSVNFGAAKNPRPGVNSWFTLSKGLDPNNPQLFISTVCQNRRNHRQAFISRNPEQSAFGEGWENRDKKACDFATNASR